MGDYVVTFAKTVEIFCWIDIDEIGIRTMPDTLYGAKALEWRFNICEGEEGVQDAKDLG